MLSLFKNYVNQKQNIFWPGKVELVKYRVSNISPFLGLIFITLVFSFTTNGRFASISNMTNLVNQCFNVIIIAVGISFVFAHGGMDMSIGSVLGVSSYVGAMVWNMNNIPGVAGFLIAILVAMVFTFITSTVHIVARVPVFVASLCIRYICSGILTTLVSENDMYIDYTKYNGLNNGILKFFVLIIVIAIGYILYEYTAVGKSLKSIGGNKTMSYHSGVKTSRYIWGAYMILGITIGIVSMFSLARVGNVTATTGVGMEFDAMTAIVLGGFPIKGGARAKIRSAIIGAVTVAVLTNGLTLIGLDPSIIYGIKGVMFIVIVGISYVRKKGEIVN